MGRFTGNSERIGSFFLSKFGEITMDETLMPSREWLHEIFHSLNDVAWSVNPIAWETLFLTPSAEAVYGYPVAEFFHNPHLWRSLIHDDDRDRVENLIPTLFSTDKLDLEYRIVRASGEIRWLYHRLRVIRDAQGQALRIDGMATAHLPHLKVSHLYLFNLKQVSEKIS